MRREVSWDECPQALQEGFLLFLDAAGRILCCFSSPQNEKISGGGKNGGEKTSRFCHSLVKSE